jgi:hypothetical protein
MKLIELTQSQITQVSDDDFNWLIQLKWCAHRKPNYAGGGAYMAVHNDCSTGKPRMILMHRAIMSSILGRELGRGEKVDHIDRNPLNNQRENLRLASATDSMCNRNRFANNKSGFKGVSWSKKSHKWKSEIKYQHQNYTLGYFTDVEEAAKAYDKAARELHGEFAVLNFPE